MKKNKIISVTNLKKYFPVPNQSFFNRLPNWNKALDEINFSIFNNEVLGIVGESGSGKTTLLKCLLLLEKPTAGSVFYKGINIFDNLSNEVLKNYRRDIQAVFQDTTSALNPRMRVSEIICEPLIAQKKLNKQEMQIKVQNVLSKVGLSEASLTKYPHEFSGGQRQRIAIARALVSNPECIFLDEPVSSLDVSIRGQVLNLLKELQKYFGLTYVIIAHDLSVIRHISCRILVLYLGHIVEQANTEELFENPMHPYTRALLSAAFSCLPNIEKIKLALDYKEKSSTIDISGGCPFYTRCPHSIEKCFMEKPGFREVFPGHNVSCWLVE